MTRTSTETAAKQWTRANGLPAPTPLQNQILRSLEVEPIFKGNNLWVCQSTSRERVTYEIEVFFGGLDDAKHLGYALNIFCGCPGFKATGICKHALKIEAKYHADHKLYFALFGLPTSARYGELHARAVSTDKRMNGELFQVKQFAPLMEAA